MVNKVVFLLVLCAFSAYSAVNFPYPQEKNYGNGTINTTAANASANLKSKFTSFISTHYEENQNKTLGRIKFDNTAQTVSEGIGYGMIMMVYFSDNSRSYKDEFDRLWAYYNNFLNQNNLMNWKINGFNNTAEYNAATDAEFDVAFALEMAYYQFGDQKYLNDAQTLIGKIKQFEMETDGLHKPGDMWNSKRNPSYVSPAAFELFKRVDNSFWTTALTRNYTLLKANQNQTTGLPSDWSSDNGNPVDNNDFGYDASRAPWRWAWSYAWYGHADAKTLLDKLAAWVSTKTATSINGAINVNGSMGGCCNNSTFIGPLMNSLQVDNKYQTNMNSYWTTMIGKTEESYFNKAMQLLTGLLATGNMPNLKALSEAQPSSSSAPSSSSISSSSSVTNSSSSNGNTPIMMLPQTALMNSAIASKNGISLAIKDNAIVEIFGLKGNSIRKFNFASGVYSVSFSDLPKGLYIVKVSFGNEKRILRIPIK